MVGFSAKEAIYKCMHPFGNHGLGFGDVELEILSARNTIAVHPGPKLAGRVSGSAIFECGFGVANGYIQTAAVLRG
jgi:4'-phosphopantetheinyl transferase EntD